MSKGMSDDEVARWMFEALSNQKDIRDLRAAVEQLYGRQGEYALLLEERLTHQDEAVCRMASTILAGFLAAGGPAYKSAELSRPWYFELAGRNVEELSVRMAKRLVGMARNGKGER